MHSTKWLCFDTCTPAELHTLLVTSELYCWEDTKLPWGKVSLGSASRLLKPILWEIISELARVKQTINDVINNDVVLLLLERQ